MRRRGIVHGQRGLNITVKTPNMAMLQLIVLNEHWMQIVKSRVIGGSAMLTLHLLIIVKLGLLHKIVLALKILVLHLMIVSHALVVGDYVKMMIVTIIDIYKNY